MLNLIILAYVLLPILVIIPAFFPWIKGTRFKILGLFEVEYKFRKRKQKVKALQEYQDNSMSGLYKYATYSHSEEDYWLGDMSFSYRL